MPTPVGKRQRYLPDFASRATSVPSRVAANTMPPAVASTPLLRDPWLVLKSHTVLPVSGSIALMPDDDGGSFGPSPTALPPRAALPMYCRPCSYGAGALAYCCPFSAYS